MQGVMSHWGVSTTHTGALPWDSVVTDINAGKPFVMAWWWAGGGGHALTGYGYDTACTWLPRLHGPMAWRWLYQIALSAG